MDDIHLSREMLRAVDEGKLRKSVVDEIKTEHLLSRCPHCWGEVQAYQAERRAGPSLLGRVAATFTILLQRTVTLGNREISRAEKELRDLLPLSPDERRSRVEKAQRRFRSGALVRLLLEESRQCLPDRPAEAFALAELSRNVANRNPGMQGYFDLYVLATAHMANACRVRDDRPTADSMFSLARQVIVEHGVTDPEVVARVDDLMGSLRKDQRRFDEAEKLLKRAAMQFGLIHAPEDAARALINLGAVHSHQGAFDQAIEATRSALALLGPESYLRLRLSGHFNLAVQLKEAGRFEEAAALIEKDEVLYCRFPEPWTQLRLTWLRGDIAAGRQDLATAERAYLEARDGFISQGIGYDAALVSLDLAVLFLRQGRTADVRRIAEEMYPIFEAQDVHREALAALTLFREAARQEEVTLGKALALASYLREARAEPALRFAWRLIDP
jgi:tetratricopeptide (TPR) repeat protein